MSEYSYYQDKTTVSLHEDDRPLLDELRDENEPNYRVLRRALRTQKLINDELERALGDETDDTPTVEVDGRAD